MTGTRLPSQGATLPNVYAPAPVPRAAPCKVCGNAAGIAGVTDLSRSGADIQHGLMVHNLELTHDQVVLDKLDPYWGEAVYYYSCSLCGFTFTPSLDHWSDEEFARRIYNEDYLRHDPGFGGVRQEGWADSFLEWFGPCRHAWTIIDYGSGLGHLEQALKDRGFGEVWSYDPFGRDRDWPPARGDIVFLNEVIEHSVDPAGSFAQLAALRKPDGVIMLTTELCDAAILARGVVNWWYCAPRSGHVSLYSEAALAICASAIGLSYTRVGRGLHLFHAVPRPDWVEAVFPHQRLIASP